MLTIFFDSELHSALEALQTAFADLGVVTGSLGESDILPIGTDAVVCSPPRFQMFQTRVHPANGSSHPRLLVVDGDTSATRTRELLRDGATAVVPLDLSTNPLPQALALLVAAEGSVSVVPAHVAAHLATALDDPPRRLTADERRLLGLAATRSVESAGRLLGLSRRQSQRRYRKICDELGFATHFDAVVATARWGLVDGDGNVAD